MFECIQFGAFEGRGEDILREKCHDSSTQSWFGCGV